MKKIYSFFLALVFCGLSLIGKSQTVIEVKYATDADVLLFATDSLSADVIVYQYSSADSATGNTGRWYFTAFANEASKRVFYVGTSSAAQLNIFFTSNPQAAGWINTSKSSLMN